MKITLATFFLLICLSASSQNLPTDFVKDQIRLKLSLPYLNHLSLKPQGGSRISKAGFIGESIGLEYSYHNDLFLEISFSLVGSFDHPLPLEKEGAYENLYSTYFSLIHNHEIKRFTIGYGLNYARNTHAIGFRSFDNMTPSTGFKNTNSTLGLNLNTYVKFWKSFNLGLIFRPTFFHLNNVKSSTFESLISIDFAWRIRLNKRS